jgi:SAM-dependent methyltransferase
MSNHGLLNSEMITALYRAFLGREPEPPALAYYMEALAEGSLDARSLITLFQNCDEYKYRQRQTNVEEEQLLRRDSVECVEYVSQEGLQTPLPDSDLIFLVVGHRDPQAFDMARRPSVDAIISFLSQAEIDYSGFGSILDFGCGCGRVLAGWEGRLSPETRLLGCDINPFLVNFCQKNISHAEIVQSSYYPPLPFRDGQFDFIYAASVYTHLTLPAMLQCTGEIARILRPDGVAMITTHGSYFVPQLERTSKRGSSLLAEKGYHVELLGSPEDTWEGSNNYGTFVSPDFLRRLFIGFELVRIFPGISFGYNHFSGHQDISIFRRS